MAFFEYETQNKTINNSLGNVLNPFKERFAKNPVLWSGLTVDRAVSHYQELYALGTLSAAHFGIEIRPYHANSKIAQANIPIFDPSNNEPYRVCRRVNILRDYPDDKTKLYPRN
nr:hypothetical protein [Acinetobacter baumannii]